MKTVLKFLRKLNKNNRRDWFLENKNEYEKAKGDFTVVVADLIQRISEFDQAVVGVNPEKCLFRIYRDIRFSRDKTPYKTNFGAYIAPNGKKSGVAGYYFHLQPGECFLAGGLYKPSGPDLFNVRTAIANRTEEFLDIIDSPKFKKYFPDITDTEKLKTAPRGFPKDHRAIQYLRLKNLIAVHRVSEDEVLREDFLDQTAEVFESMTEFIGFIRSV